MGTIKALLEEVADEMGGLTIMDPAVLIEAERRIYVHFPERLPGSQVEHKDGKEIIDGVTYRDRLQPRNQWLETYDDISGLIEKVEFWNTPERVSAAYEALCQDYIRTDHGEYQQVDAKMLQDLLFKIETQRAEHRPKTT